MSTLYAIIGFIVFWGVVLGIVIFLAFWALIAIGDRQDMEIYEKELNGRNYDGKGKV